MRLLDLLFPVSCLNCKKSGSYLCKNCLSKVDSASLICPECKYYSFKGKTHLKCKNKHSLDGLISVWRYEGVVRKAIIKLKYTFVADIARELSDKIIMNLDVTFLDKAILIPIPLHVKRENWRGFNQSAEIAKLLAKRLKLEYAGNLLMRTKYGAPQVQLKRKERLQNIGGKYAVNREFDLSKVKNRTLILIDDVWTTGSTMKEACRVLKKAGIKHVLGISVARS